MTKNSKHSVSVIPPGLPGSRQKQLRHWLCDIANYDRFSVKNWVTLLRHSGS